jgi:DNA repair exonuclease SbcCD ATPase subunit
MSKETIQKRMKIIDDLSEELNSINALYKESLDEDPIYQEVQEQEKTFKDAHKEAKDAVMEKPVIKEFKSQLSDLRKEIKENREALAQELAEYFKETGEMEVEDADGNVKRMIFSVKLISQ